MVLRLLSTYQRIVKTIAWIVIIAVVVGRITTRKVVLVQLAAISFKRCWVHKAPREITFVACSPTALANRTWLPACMRGMACEWVGCHLRLRLGSVLWATAGRGKAVSQGEIAWGAVHRKVLAVCGGNRPKAQVFICDFFTHK